MARIAVALASPPVYAAEARRDRGGAPRDRQPGGVHPVLLARLFLLLASALIPIVLASHHAASRSAS